METIKLSEMSITKPYPSFDEVLSDRGLPKEESEIFQTLDASKRLDKDDSSFNSHWRYAHLPRYYPFWYVNSYYATNNFTFRFNGRGYPIYILPNLRFSFKAVFRPDKDTEIPIDTSDNKARENLLRMLGKYNVYCDDDLTVYNIMVDTIDPEVYPRLEIENDMCYQIKIYKDKGNKELYDESISKEELMRDFLNPTFLTTFFAQMEARKKKSASSGFTK